jgi:hypothetical protein
VLTVGMAGLVAGPAHLTVFEALAFGSVITWLHTLETREAIPHRPAPRPFTANSQHLIPPFGGQGDPVLLSRPQLRKSTGTGDSADMKVPPVEVNVPSREPEPERAQLCPGPSIRAQATGAARAMRW